MTEPEWQDMLLFNLSATPVTEVRRIKCKKYSVYVNHWDALLQDIEQMRPSSVFVLTDQQTAKFCLHRFLEKISIPVHVITIAEGEIHKQLDTCQQIWSFLMKKGADRKSLMINLGGGVVGDMGGFCAATFMRGISFIQMPTTLLSQVDASVGGKLGIDFLGFKNMVGVVQAPHAVYIMTEFLSSLPEREMRSGYAEMLKHGLIADATVWHRLSRQMPADAAAWGREVVASVEIKKKITDEDPQERGIRKILNFGHTIGHALESRWLISPQPLLHGEAVAIGLITEAFVSYRLGGLTEDELFEIRERILSIYGHHPRYVGGSDEIIELIRSDKKNINGQTRMVLLSGIGQAIYNQVADDQLVREALMFYREKL